jgi:hypothetical protein
MCLVCSNIRPSELGVPCLLSFLPLFMCLHTAVVGGYALHAAPFSFVFFFFVFTPSFCASPLTTTALITDFHGLSSSLFLCAGSSSKGCERNQL